MEAHSNFLVIDDDLVNNLICKLTIEQALGKVNIKTFDVPEKGLTYIQNEYIDCKDNIPIVFFLDINMPTMSGWEFLEQFEDFPEETKKCFIIYILSSSVDERDIKRAEQNKNVKAFLTKPLSVEVINKVAREAQ